MAEYTILGIPLMATIITTVQPLPELTAKTPHNMTLRTISVLKAGDCRHKVILLILEVPLTSPLSPQLLAGTTVAPRRASLLAPTVTGGLLPRAVAAISTAWATTMVD